MPPNANIQDSIMPDQQPEALRLADKVLAEDIGNSEFADALSDELRRQHAEIERLQASIVFAVHKLEASRIWGGSDWHYNPLHPMYYQPALDSLRDAIRRPASVPALGEPVASDDDLDLAKATVRGAGYSLVTSRFIIAFAEFIQDWKKGDFDLPKLAALDVESAFEAWQATDNIAEANRALAAPLPPAPAAVPFEFIEHAWRLTLIGATGCSRAEAEHVIAQSMESARLLASLAAPPAAQAPANTITLSDLIAQHEADPERKAALDEARAQLQRPIEIEIIEHPTQRCACQGAETLGTKIQGSDARECIECGTIVRWDLVEHKFYGFAATCIRANERIVMHTLPDTQTAALLRKALHRAHWFGQEFLKADEANYDRVHQEFVAHIEATIAALPACVCVEYGEFPHQCLRFPPEIIAALADIDAQTPTGAR